MLFIIVHELGNIIKFFLFFFLFSIFKYVYISLILLVIIVILLFVISTAFLTLLERKKISSFQHRRGPNKTGALGILQPFSDAFKLIFKEIIIPRNSIFIVFILSPILSSIFGFLN